MKFFLAWSGYQNAEPQAAIVAGGFSCQQRIANGSFGKPRHIAGILYAAVTIEQEPL